jgi:hypothetical protein
VLPIYFISKLMVLLRKVMRKCPLRDGWGRYNINMNILLICVSTAKWFPSLRINTVLLFRKIIMIIIRHLCLDKNKNQWSQQGLSRQLNQPSPCSSINCYLFSLYNFFIEFFYSSNLIFIFFIVTYFIWNNLWNVNYYYFNFFIFQFFYF